MSKLRNLIKIFLKLTHAETVPKLSRASSKSGNIVSPSAVEVIVVVVTTTVEVVKISLVEIVVIVTVNMYPIKLKYDANSYNRRPPSIRAFRIGWN